MRLGMKQDRLNWDRETAGSLSPRGLRASALHAASPEGQTSRLARLPKAKAEPIRSFNAQKTTVSLLLVMQSGHGWAEAECGRECCRAQMPEGMVDWGPVWETACQVSISLMGKQRF